MSYDKIIGFGVNPDKPKGPRVPLTSKERDYFDRLGVKPIFHDLKKSLPENNREAESKLFVQNSKGLRRIRELIASADNAFLIPGQVYEGKNPLTSILLDSKGSLSSASAHLDRHNYTLRYRFEMDPATGNLTQGDYNEKSAMGASNMIAGCTDRFERELEQRAGESLEDAFNAFIRKYRRRNDPTFCDQIPFSNLGVAAGYQAARNELGIAVKHPDADVIIVYEGCEDFWHSNLHDMSVMPFAKFYEFETEPKQVWGELPSYVQSPEDFQRFINGAMAGLHQYLHLRTPGSNINLKSKAEITKEHVEETFGFKNTRDLGLTQTFDASTAIGYYSEFTAFQFALAMGDTLEGTLKNARDEIHRHAATLHAEKMKYNSFSILPDMDGIGRGSHSISFSNDNGLLPDSPVAKFG